MSVETLGYVFGLINSIVVAIVSVGLVIYLGYSKGIDFETIVFGLAISALLEFVIGFVPCIIAQVYFGGTALNNGSYGVHGNVLLSSARQTPVSSEVFNLILFLETFERSMMWCFSLKILLVYVCARLIERFSTNREFAFSDGLKKRQRRNRLD